MNETLSVASVERISAGNANLPSKLVVMPLVCPPSLSSTVAPTTGAPLSSFTAPFRETGFPPGYCGRLHQYDTPVFDLAGAVG